jgi:hypothetical protein
MEQDMANKLIHILMPLLGKSLSQWKPESNPQRLDSRLEQGGYYAADCTERRVHVDPCKEMAFSTAVSLHNFRTMARKKLCS